MRNLHPLSYATVMPSRTFLLALLLAVYTPALHAEDEELCNAHDWFTARSAVSGSSTSPLCEGAMDSSFEHRKAAISKLDRVIATDPKGAQAYRAHEILSSLFFSAGQYREALKELDAMLVLKPTAEDLIEERPLLLALSKSPDQSGRVKRFLFGRSVIDDGNPHFPVLANGKPAVWFMDTGANISVMSDAEADALGLMIRPVDTKIADISGSKTSLKVTEIDDLIIGKTHLRHVGFIVLPHSHPPFDDIPTDQQAILGIQVLRALGTISVNKGGQVEIGATPSVAAPSSPMVFCDAMPVVQMDTEGKTLSFTLDTGAVHTTLNPPFASAFPKLVEGGEKKEHTLTGMSGSSQQHLAVISQARFTLAGKQVVLSPATVLLQQTTETSAWAAGNLGYDLIRQMAPFTIDFRTMRFYHND
jgi:predicted aspartyl protease